MLSPDRDIIRGILLCYLTELFVSMYVAFLISNFRRVLYVVCFLLGDSPASIPILFSNLVIIHLLAYEDGTDRVFRNVGL
jgi:hypothetical protein